MVVAPIRLGVALWSQAATWVQMLDGRAPDRLARIRRLVGLGPSAAIYGVGINRSSRAGPWSTHGPWRPGPCSGPGRGEHVPSSRHRGEGRGHARPHQRSGGPLSGRGPGGELEFLEHERRHSDDGRAAVPGSGSPADDDLRLDLHPAPSAALAAQNRSAAAPSPIGIGPKESSEVPGGPEVSGEQTGE
jgi:hypothetical protein